MQLLLASTSSYRRALLARLGLPFEAVPPPFDEEVAKRALAALSVEELSMELARGKARSVARPGSLVIGSDQIAVIDGMRLDKPGTVEAARAQLRHLAGRTHRLVTSVVVVNGTTGEEHTAIDVHTLTMRSLDDGQIARYVDRDRPLDCAGSYKIESAGVALFESVEGRDATAIVGLPLLAVTAILRRFGMDPLDAL